MENNQTLERERYCIDKDDRIYTFEVKQHLNKILEHAHSLGMSDVRCQTTFRVTGRLDGKNMFLTNYVLKDHDVNEIINHIYGSDGSATVSKGIPVDPSYKFMVDRTKKLRFRVNAHATERGAEVVFRSIPDVPPRIQDIGISQEVYDSFRVKQGLLVITGATGSGKSTTMAAIIRGFLEDEAGEQNILTFESPIEFYHDGYEMGSSTIAQSEVPRMVKSFAEGARGALRRAPTGILVGESRDKETIEASILLSMTGHWVMTTLHTNGVPSTIRRMAANFSGDEAKGKIVDLCENLRKIYSQTLAHKVGGGRIALFETLDFTPDVKKRIIDAVSISEEAMIKETRACLHEFGQPMYVTARKALGKGLISQITYDNIVVEYGGPMTDEGSI